MLYRCVFLVILVSIRLCIYVNVDADWGGLWNTATFGPCGHVSYLEGAIQREYACTLHRYQQRRALAALAWIGPRQRRSFESFMMTKPWICWRWYLLQILLISYVYWMLLYAPSPVQTAVFCSWLFSSVRLYSDGLVQDCSISIANALEILQSCTKPSIWCLD